MSLTTKNQLQITIQTIKKLLSFKADKTEVAKKVDNAEFLAAKEEIAKKVDNTEFLAVKAEISNKVDKRDLPDADHAIELAMECGLIDPVLSSDGFIYADENGAIYTL